VEAATERVVAVAERPAGTAVAAGAGEAPAAGTPVAVETLAMIWARLAKKYFRICLTAGWSV
jgi:hypothetical protein